MKDNSDICKKSNNNTMLMTSSGKGAHITTTATGYTVSHTSGDNHTLSFEQVPAHLANVSPLPALQKSLFVDPMIRAARKIAFASEDVRSHMERLRGVDCEIADSEHNRPKGRPEMAFGMLTVEQNKIVFNKSNVIVTAGDESKYHGYLFQGPYEEKIAGKLRGVYKGIYRNGVKEVWGKMVGYL